MPSMTTQQIYEFLTSGRHLLKLATLTPEGWPYVVPLWYDYDGETFTVAGRRKARWVANIRNDSRVSGCIDTSEALYSRVLFEATAEIVDDSWIHTSSDRALRYLGGEAGLRYFEETRGNPRALIRIKPREFVSWTGPGWHPRYNE